MFLSVSMGRRRAVHAAGTAVAGAASSTFAGAWKRPALDVLRPAAAAAMSTTGPSAGSTVRSMFRDAGASEVRARRTAKWMDAAMAADPALASDSACLRAAAHGPAHAGQPGERKSGV